VLHVLAVTLADYNVFLNIFDVKAATYSELIGPSHNGELLALDRAAAFAGFGLASVLLLWAPWEKLALYAKVIRGNLTPILVAILALILWEGIIDWRNIEQFLLPKPSVIGAELADIYPRLLAAGWFTFLNAFKGFLVGCGLGVFTGIISARFTRFSTAVLPLAIAANSIPIIAFAPIANFWFGVTSPNSKIAIVAVLCYFPAMISTVRGLTSVDTTQLELMQSYAATEVDIFRRLRIPNALPFMFSAFKLATTLSMIGAIVAEFFGGSLSGLGYRIREDAVLFRFPESWSAIIVASLFGMSFYLLISALERAAMPWYRSFRSEA
jgi:NitT/TauT family transport system permease protein